MSKLFDLVIKNARVVRPNKTSVDCLDIGIKGGKISRLAPELAAGEAEQVFDGKNYLAFPGCVDAHMHVGIYSPLAEDAVSESKAAAMGGVTSSLNYIRTGHYYLNRGGPYREFMPEVFKQSNGRFWVDYGYHIAPIEAAHIDEMEHLVLDHGVTSFKIFMFYGGYGLHGPSSQQNEFLMTGPDDRYDIAHFEFIMRSAQRLMAKFPDKAPYISVSLHCELAEILNAYTKIVEREGKLTGLAAYSAARPPHSEGLGDLDRFLSRQRNELPEHQPAAFELAQGDRGGVDHATGVPACRVPPRSDRRPSAARYQLRMRRSRQGQSADPAARGRRSAMAGRARSQGRLDRQRSRLLFGRAEMVQGRSGQYLAGKIGLRRHRVSALRRAERGQPARHVVQPYGGASELEPGAALRPAQQRRHRARLSTPTSFSSIHMPNSWFAPRNSESHQGYSPFEGVELTGRVKCTFLRGGLIYSDGKIVGPPRGEYLSRPRA